MRWKKSDFLQVPASYTGRDCVVGVKALGDAIEGVASTPGRAGRADADLTILQERSVGLKNS